MTEATATLVAQRNTGNRGRRALRAAMFGFFVDMYDIYLPVVVLGPAIGYFTAPDLTAVQKATLTSAIFAVSLIGRPLGSVIFGAMGDRLGRRRTTLLAVTGCTVCTGLIALLPGHSAVGGLAPVLLVALRLLDGVFLGGEYTAANPLAMEYAPRSRRGLHGSLLNIGYPMALAVITVLTMLLLRVIPSAGHGSAYVVWGWRIPFGIGVLLSGAVAVYYLRTVPESELWTRLAKANSPLRTLFSGRNRRSLGRAFVVGTGMWLTLDATVGVFAGHFQSLGTASSVVDTAILAASVTGIGLFPLIGIAGQRFGRRQVFVVLGLLNLVTAPALLGIAIANAHTAAVVVVSGGLALVCALTVWAVISAFLMEMFPTEVRSSGYGIAYSLPSVIPACYPYIMIGLSSVIPYGYTPVVLLALGGLFLVVGSWRSPDLRPVELADIR